MLALLVMNKNNPSRFPYILTPHVVCRTLALGKFGKGFRKKASPGEDSAQAHACECAGVLSTVRGHHAPLGSLLVCRSKKGATRLGRGQRRAGVWRAVRVILFAPGMASVVLLGKGLKWACNSNWMIKGKRPVDG